MPKYKCLWVLNNYSLLEIRPNLFIRMKLIVCVVSYILAVNMFCEGGLVPKEQLGLQDQDFFDAKVSKNDLEELNLIQVSWKTKMFFNFKNQSAYNFLLVLFVFFCCGINLTY